MKKNKSASSNLQLKLNSHYFGQHFFAPQKMSLVLLFIGATAAAAAPKVKTEYGIVEGLDEFGCDVFHGVPFAAPPTGPLRWKQPVAPTPWTDVKPTVLAGAMCPQIDLTKGLVLGHEDCLYLSVYSPPQCTAATPCPVMFWIYGGAWILGNNEEFSVYNAINLAVAGGVVVVAANYVSVHGTSA